MSLVAKYGGVVDSRQPYY